jgi:rRNA-processing protein FCF1
LLNVIKHNWHLESLLESITTESYKLVVPRFILTELHTVKEKLTIKNGAKRFVEEQTELLDDTEYLKEMDYKKPVDDRLIALAQQIACKKYIMTQDRRLIEKILQKDISVILVSYGRAKLFRPIRS